MTASITVRHNFETGHRLPFLQGKCENLHGHSWWVEVTVETPKDHQVVIEFGKFKSAVRGWIDDNLDHGLMLGKDDPLVPILRPFGKVYVFGEEGPAEHLKWPTVENVARMLAVVAQQLLNEIPRVPGAAVVEVKVSETHVNEARWARG